MLGAFPLLVGSLLLGDGPVGPRVAPADFQAWFAEASDESLSIPANVEARARRFRYVFVAGFGNEKLPGYFAQNAKELRVRGVPRNAIHYIYPSSHETCEENLGAIRDRFLEIAAEGPEPLVVIGHSRGACDTLAFALRNPKFVRERVHALFLVQGPFGGSGIADYVTGEGAPLDREIPLKYRVIARLCEKREQRLLKRGKHEGLRDMTRSASQRFWEAMLEENADAIPIVAPKAFYVTTETGSDGMRLFRRAAATYMDAHFGPNDGVVALDDQSLPGLGTVLAVLDVGHSDLTNRSGRGDRQLRRALIQAVLMAVGQGDVTPEEPHDRQRFDQGR